MNNDALNRLQGSIDKNQKKCLTILGRDELADPKSARLIQSKAAHHSFESNQTNFLVSNVNSRCKIWNVFLFSVHVIYFN